MRTSAIVMDVKQGAFLPPDDRTGDRLQAAVEKIERDVADDLIAALVLCRHTGMTRDEAMGILFDTYAAPWSSAGVTHER